MPENGGSLYELICFDEDNLSYVDIDFGTTTARVFESRHAYLSDVHGWEEDSLGLASLFLEFGDTQFDGVIGPSEPYSEPFPEFNKLLNDTDNDDPQCYCEQQSAPLASVELLDNHISEFEESMGETRAKPMEEPTSIGGEGKQLSTEQIVRIAGARFVQSSSPTSDPQSGNYPFGISFFESELPNDVLKDVELAETLFLSAEKVQKEQYDAAGKLLDECDSLSSDSGDPVQRLAYYFSEALWERIDRKTGKTTTKGLAKKQTRNLDEAMMNSPTLLAVHERLPFSQILQCAGMQAIIESMANANKVHVIDLGIKIGLHWTILMQALAYRKECPLKLLKITAVGTCSMHLIEETGKRLMSFAASLNIPFAFRVVMVSDMLNLKESFFEKALDEKVAVYAPFSLRSLIHFPDRLEAIMKVVRNMNPRVMVVAEVEANHNSKSFVSRFTEALFYFSAYFDCLETFMARDDPHRMILESVYFSQGIRNIVAAEGEERNIRHVNIDVWRKFFARFGMMEVEFSTSSLHQINILADKFGCSSYVTIDRNESCLLIGWKGTPLNSLSVWEIVF